MAVVPKEGIAVVYGFVDPVTKKVIPYKILIPRYIVDADRLFPSPKRPPEEEELTSEDRKFVDRYSKFTMIPTAEKKVRFFIYSDPELDSLKALLDEDEIAYTTSLITLTPEQETAIKECEASKVHIREVIKRLGL